MLDENHPTGECVVAALQAARTELCEVVALEDANRAVLAERAELLAAIRLARLSDEDLLLWDFDHPRRDLALSTSGRQRSELEAEIAVLEQIAGAPGRVAR